MSASEVQVYDGVGVRPWPVTYDEAVERLRPILLECNYAALTRGDGTLGNIVMMETGLTTEGTLYKQVVRAVYDATDQPLAEVYNLPIKRLAEQFGGLVLAMVMKPTPPVAYNDNRMSSFTVSGTG